MKKEFKKIYIHKVFIIANIVLTIAACEKVGQTDLDEIDATANNSSMLVLGDQIPNAYTIENMTQAYINLVQSGKKGVIELDLPLNPTHFYVRFLPNSENELYELQKDTTLILFDFPLDYEIIGNGTYYHDPSLPNTMITWQYCAVEAEYDFPEIKYEILEELFLPDSKIESTCKNKNAGWSFWDDLEQEALRLKDLLDESELKSTYSTRFEPFGQIKVVDNSGLGTLGLEGVQIIATRGFTSKPGITDADGKFTINHEFRGSVKYKIKWERDDFDIRSGTYGQAYFIGPEQEAEWNYTFSTRDISWCYAHIHRAAFNYYYKNGNYGILPPPRQGGLLNQRLHIGAMDKDGRSHYYDFNSFVFAATVKVYCKKNSSYKISVDLFGTTTHELAHASHWHIGYSTAQYLIDYIFSSAFLPESWAECVENVLTSDIYKTTSHNNWNSNQNLTIASFFDGVNDGYTPVFIDLMDDINQSIISGILYPVDQVKDYTLSELENVLIQTYNILKGFDPPVLQASWESFSIGTYKNKLEKSYVNSTEVFIDELFDNYLD